MIVEIDNWIESETDGGICQGDVFDDARWKPNQSQALEKIICTYNVHMIEFE